MENYQLREVRVKRNQWQEPLNWKLWKIALPQAHQQGHEESKNRSHGLTENTVRKAPFFSAFKKFFPVITENIPTSIQFL